MLINKKLNKKTPDGFYKNIFNGAFKLLITLISISFFSVGVFHFSADTDFRLKVYQKIDYYFLPLESSFYSLGNISRLLSSYFFPLQDKDIISINSNFISPE